MTQPQSQTGVAPTDEVSFTCVAEAFPDPTYSWTTPTGTMSGSTTIIISVNFNSVGEYVCTASSNGVDVVSDVATLTGKKILDSMS